VHRKRVAEHRPAALRLLLSRLVLDDVPVFDKDTLLDPEDVRRDPVHGCPEPRKPPMNDNEVAISHDHAGLVFQRRRHALDEVEEALAAGSDVRAVLDVRGRPVALRRDVVALVEQGIEGLKYEGLIPLLFRLTHNDLLVVWRLRCQIVRTALPKGRSSTRKRRASAALASGK